MDIEYLAEMLPAVATERFMLETAFLRMFGKSGSWNYFETVRRFDVSLSYWSKADRLSAAVVEIL